MNRKHAYIGTQQALRERCTIDIDTGCWLWQGATSTDGTPRLHTFDHRRIEKRTMSGPVAAWNIAHQAAPLDGWLVMRRCGHKLCLSPSHLKEFPDRRAMGAFIRLAGWRKGNSTEQRRANVRLAQVASGHPPTPREIVLAIRAAPAGLFSSTLAAQYGIARQTVSRIRLGQSHREVA